MVNNFVFLVQLEARMIFLPTGIQDLGKFKELATLYADKTRHIYDLYKRSSYDFLSRPGRFGNCFSDN